MKLSQIPKTKPPFVPLTLLIETQEELSEINLMAFCRRQASETAKKLWEAASEALRNCE